MYETLLVDRKGGILKATINRPKALNALNAQVFVDLDKLFSNIEDDVRGVIITGSGEKSFVAGADIKEFSGLSRERAVNLSRRGQKVFEKIEGLRIPVIAAVNGFALGGGCELALACHIRIASENARFGQPEVNLGLIPGYGGTIRLPKIIGPSQAMKLLLTGDMIGAQEAMTLGLVVECCPIEELMERAEALMNKIVSKSPHAVASILEVVKSVSYVDQDYVVEAETFGKCMVHAEAHEGISAFLEKRKPNF